MKLIHSLSNKRIEKEVKEDAGFLLTNKIGGYCYLSDKPISRYQGVFFNKDFKMYKVIDAIKLINASKVSELRNNFSNVQRKRGNIIESFFMPYSYNSFVYELNKSNEVEIVLDIRESYSNPEFGRFYEISEENGRIVIKYRQENEFECYLIISGYENYDKTEIWFEQEYCIDKERNSLPFEKYVFSALKLRSKKLVFSFSFSKEEAIRENDFVSNNINKLKNNQRNIIEGVIKKNKGTINKIKNKETQLAYICALNSLNNLFVEIDNKDGIFAGLPWFFQFWTRDEAISLKALKKITAPTKIELILLRLIDSIRNGLVLNKYGNGDLAAADSIGWIVKRISDLDKKLLKNETVFNVFHELDGHIAVSGPKQTWMDSISREGARIEIQALKLSMLKAANNLNLEGLLKSDVKEKFWNGQYLKDGIDDDDAIRPNIFITAYIYPELLTKEEWATCFENILKKLWRDWGGLTTIDKSSGLFCRESTGEDPKSYHNGDSWFWINNLAALVLFKTDKNKFKKYINQVLNSSTQEILWKGIIGQHAELSSAIELRSEGCLTQAWSAAMFIELINELF